MRISLARNDLSSIVAVLALAVNSPVHAQLSRTEAVLVDDLELARTSLVLEGKCEANTLKYISNSDRIAREAEEYVSTNVETRNKAGKVSELSKALMYSPFTRGRLAAVDESQRWQYVSDQNWFISTYRSAMPQRYSCDKQAVQRFDRALENLTNYFRAQSPEARQSVIAQAKMPPLRGNCTVMVSDQSRSMQDRISDGIGFENITYAEGIARTVGKYLDPKVGDGSYLVPAGEAMSYVTFAGDVESNKLKIPENMTPSMLEDMKLAHYQEACKSTHVPVSMSSDPRDKAKILAAMRSMKAGGASPVAAGIATGMSQLRGCEKKRLIVFSDLDDSCDRDVCALVTAYRSMYSETELEIDLAVIDVNSKTKKRVAPVLNCLERNAQARIFPANSLKQIEDAVSAAMPSVTGKILTQSAPRGEVAVAGSLDGNEHAETKVHAQLAPGSPLPSTQAPSTHPFVSSAAQPTARNLTAPAAASPSAAQVSESAPAKVQSLDELEKHLFLNSYPKQPTSERIERLEKQVFGGTSPEMSSQQRVERLSNALPRATSNDNAPSDPHMPVTEGLKATALSLPVAPSRALTQHSSTPTPAPASIANPHEAPATAPPLAASQSMAAPQFAPTASNAGGSMASARSLADQARDGIQAGVYHGTTSKGESCTVFVKHLSKWHFKNNQPMFDMSVLLDSDFGRVWDPVSKTWKQGPVKTSRKGEYLQAAFGYGSNSNSASGPAYLNYGDLVARGDKLPVPVLSNTKLADGSFAFTMRHSTYRPRGEGQHVPTNRYVDEQSSSIVMPIRRSAPSSKTSDLERWQREVRVEATLSGKQLQTVSMTNQDITGPGPAAAPKALTCNGLELVKPLETSTIDAPGPMPQKSPEVATLPDHNS